MKAPYSPREMAPLLLVLSIGVLCSLLLPDFARTANFLNIFKQSSYLAIVSAGMLFVLIAGEIDLSVGSQFGFYGMLCAAFMMSGLPIPIVLFFVAVSAGLAGSAIGFAVSAFEGRSLMLTIAIALALRGCTHAIGRGSSIFGLPQVFTQGFSGQTNVVLAIIAMLLCGIVDAFVLHKTYFGKSLYFVGADLYAAKQSGVSARRSKTLAFSLCSIYTALAAVLYLRWVGTAAYSAGVGMELDALTVAAVAGVGFDGGKGKVLPMLLSAIFLGLLSASFIALNIAPYFQNILKGFILFSAILVNRAKS
jgi:ribose/xylose/arabinose/galactoside ABC-type transport system permease subunit